jgi:prepilin-type N-terminal cleavage/methylation domain-containing protein
VGVTMIELMITVVVIGVLAAIAVPSMYEFIMRKRVEGVADELMVDLRLLRTVPMMGGVKAQGRAEIRFRSDAAMSCYSIYVRSVWSSCDCLNTPTCTSMTGIAPQEVKLVRLPTSKHVVVQPVVPSPSVLRLDDLNGLPHNGATLTIEVSAPQGGIVRVTTSATGQPAICSVAGHEGAYPVCPP